MEKHKAKEERTLQFIERKKELIVRRHWTKTMNKYEIYNMFQRLKKEERGLIDNIESAQNTLNRIQNDIKELEPYFLRIKDEVVGELKKEKQPPSNGPVAS